jgi:transitional endoplasmic reticulum ATPase
VTGFDVADRPAHKQQLTLTARLNTSALDSRRGVVRLHPEAIAALGIREWDAVSLTGSRTTAAVAGVAPPGTPAGTALLDDVTLSNAGLREDTTVIVAPVTVYGARSVTVTGSNLATQSISSATLRQALLGKVMTVGDGAGDAIATASERQQGDDGESEQSQVAHGHCLPWTR